MAIDVIDYNAAWPDLAAAARAELQTALPGVFIPIDHAKTGLIQELTDAARAERGLPSIPVWEK